jgi:hypothetical protein
VHYSSIFIYRRKQKSDVMKRKTKYLSCHERTRITLLRQSRDSTLVRPYSFESTYISSPMGFIVQCFLKESLSAIRSNFPLLSDFCFSFLTSFSPFWLMLLSTTHRTRISDPDGGDRTPHKLQKSEELRMSHVTGVNTSRKNRQAGDARRKGEMHTQCQ